MINEPDLRQQLSRIEALFQRTGAATAGDLELQAHWCRYLCVLVAGFLERVHSILYSRFAYGAASKPVADFVAAKLRRTFNPKARAFVNTARQFKAEWATDLEAFLAINGRKDAIDSIMSNRHQIAHGQHSGITVARVRQYLDLCLEVVEFIEMQCNK